MASIFEQLGGVLGGRFGESEAGSQIGGIIEGVVNKKKKKNKVIQVTPPSNNIGELRPANPLLVAGFVGLAALGLVLIMRK